MYPDLDERADYYLDVSLERKSLDNDSDNELKFADLYVDYYEKLAFFENSSSKNDSSSVNSPVCFQKNPVLIDIGPILTTDDSRFVQMVYSKLLGRDAEDSAIKKFGEEYANKLISKLDFIEQIAASEEFKNSNKMICGYERLPLSFFLQYEGKEFVKNAYIHILKRHADSEGLMTYYKTLLRGDMVPVDVLHALLHSPEASGNRLVIEGLDSAYSKLMKHRKIYNLPVIGKFARAYRTFRYMDAKINRVIGMADEINELNERSIVLADRVNNLSGKISYIGSTVDRLKNQTKLSLDEVKTYISKVDKEAGKNSDDITNLKANKADAAEFANLVKAKEDIDSYIHSIGDNVSVLNDAVSGLNEASKQIGYINSELANMKVQLKHITTEGVALAPSASANSSGAEAPVAPVTKGNDYDVIDYFDFENHFRGPREGVKKSQAMYLPYFEGRKNVLDLGCGRGEFTELLLENGVGVTGVDLYEPYVEYMKMLNLPSVHGDAVEYLRQAPTVDGIFLGQVVEHIPLNKIFEICELAYEKLPEGGYLIIETPNPMSLAIFYHCFYMDPSHQKPVHPKTLEYIAQKAGFTSTEILFTEASKYPRSIPRINEGDADYKDFNDAMADVSNLLYGSQDYALVARK